MFGYSYWYFSRVNYLNVPDFDRSFCTSFSWPTIERKGFLKTAKNFIIRKFTSSVLLLSPFLCWLSRLLREPLVMKGKMLVLASDKVVFEPKTMPMMTLISTIVLPPSLGHSPVNFRPAARRVGTPLGPETATCSLSYSSSSKRELSHAKILLTNKSYFNNTSVHLIYITFTYAWLKFWKKM